MKSLKFFVAMAALMCFTFTSCNKEEIDKPQTSQDVGVVEIGAVLNDFLTRQQEQAIPECSEDDAMYARVVLTYGSEEVDVIIPLIIENGNIFTDYSEELEIPIPNEGDKTIAVSLDHFWVYGEEPGDDSEPIWVAPQDESEYENFVNEALPYVFDLRAGSKKYVDVEVLCFDDRDVNLYGYQFFDIIPTQLYEFCLFANYCAPRHYTANYSVDITYIGGGEEFNIHTGEMPETGNYEGDWFAEPLCLAIPGPLYGESDDENYLSVTVTLEAWDDNYPTPAEEYEETFELSWDDVESYFGDDDSIDYEHIFFNCGDEPGGGDCPITEGDTDGDCIPNQDDVCPGYDDTEDMDGDGVPDGCDECPEDAGDPLDGGCPIDDCTGDADGDGINDCDDECPYQAGPESNNGCPEDGDDICETAYMEGDTELNTLANNNRWGWAENFQTSVDGDSESFDIWAGAGQNDTSKGEHIATAEISVDGDEITLEITLEPGVSLDELHINLSEDAPSGDNVFAPGQYNLNDEVGPETLTYTWDRDYSDDFYIIVHAVACY